MKIQPILSSILALALLGACKSPTTIVVNNDVGIIRGSVTLYNISGDSLSDHSGATISLEGTSYQTMSQTNGDFQLNNIPAGIYTVIVTKPDYDTELTSSYQFSGAGTQFLLGEAIQAVPFDSLPIVSVSVSKTTSDTNGFVYYQYNLNLTFAVSGPDSSTLHYFIWNLVNARTDSSAYDALLYVSYGSRIFDSTISQSFSRSFNTINAYYGNEGWKPGDTVYIETRAIARSRYYSQSTYFVSGTLSPYIVRKKIVLP